jgi:hypothetical protein
MTMTQNKDLKRLVRARMKKTGESYTSARAQITRKPKEKTPTAATPAAVSVKDYAKLAGMSDAAITEKTGCTWEKWVKSLDYHGAENMSHRDIAQLVSKTYKVPSWWTQTVTVGYERIKGLRARGQRRDGSYEATKSRTFNVPVDALFDAWNDTRKRNEWLTGATVKVRSATKPKYLRLDWNGNSIIAVGFLSKGSTKSSVAIQHSKLPDRATADSLRKYWSDQLENLAGVLGL